MRQNCIDLFEKENLPFKSFFNTCLDHDEDSHDEPEVIWLLCGAITISCEGNQFSLRQDDVFFFNSHQKHSIASHGDTVSLSFRFKKDNLADFKLHFDRIPFNNRVYRIEELIHKYHQVPLIMLQLIRLLESSDMTEDTRYQLIGYYNMYLFDLYTVRLKDRFLDIKKKNYDPYLIRFHTINTYIHRQCAKKITLDMLGKLVKISPHRVSHFIKEVLGISFQEYIQNVRLEKALEMLKLTDLPIKHIVKQCGFSDQKYLNALMRERFHVTALQYRKYLSKHSNEGVGDVRSEEMRMALSQRLDYIRHHVKVEDTYGLDLNLEACREKLIEV